MAKRPTPDHASASLTVRERLLLFCIGSRTDWQRAGVTGEIVTALVVKGFIVRGCRRVCVSRLAHLSKSLAQNHQVKLPCPAPELD